MNVRWLFQWLKKSLTVVWIFFSFTWLFALEQSDKIKVHSSPVKVTVYPDRALVERVVLVPLVKGFSTIEFVDLPSGIDPATVTISADKNKTVQIYSVETARDYGEQKNSSENREVKNLEESLLSLKKEKQTLDDRLKNLQKNKLLLESVNVKLSSDLNGQLKEYQIDPLKWQALIDFSYRSHEEVDKKSREVKELLALKEKEIEKLNGQLQNLKIKKDIIYKTVASIEAAAAVDVKFLIQYITYNASWIAGYNFRTDDGSSIAMEYLGIVKQSSGESWKNVSMTLSTARPAMGLKPGELKPLHVRPLIFREFKSKREAPASAAAAPSEKMALKKDQSDEYTVDLEEEVAPLPEPSVMESEVNAVSFVLSRPVEIPGNNTPVSVPVLNSTFKAIVAYNSVPQLSDGVFMSSKILNSLSYPVLPGEARLYIKDRYAGNTRLDAAAISEPFFIPLGVDESIKVTHKKIKEYREDTGLTERKERVTYHYQIEMENLKSTPVTVELKERIPVASDENIKIITKDISPESFTSNPSEPGILIWKIKLATHEKKNINIEYFIETPRGMQIEQFE